MTLVRLHHRLEGEGEAVLVMGASLGATHVMWEPQVTALSATRRVLRFDTRGHGESPVPSGPYSIDDLGRDVLALLDRLALGRVDYCGLSLGGMIGQWLAIHAPERIDRLILVCTSAHLPPAGGWTKRARAVRDAGTPAAVAEAVVGRWLTAEWAAAHPRERDRLLAMIGSVPAEGYAGCCEAIAEMDQRPGLSAIAAPTLVIAGRQDQATPPEHGETIAAAVPGARLEVLDPAAHLASVERAGDVTRLITDHLKETR
jgi:3-oxoadipate enol-lactonase